MRRSVNLISESPIWSKELFSFPLSDKERKYKERIICTLSRSRSRFHQAKIRYDRKSVYWNNTINKRNFLLAQSLWYVYLHQYVNAFVSARGPAKAWVHFVVEENQPAVTMQPTILTFSIRFKFCFFFLHWDKILNFFQNLN